MPSRPALRARAQGPAGGAEQAARLAAEADDRAAGAEAGRASLERLGEAARLWLSAGERVEAARALVRAGRLRLLLNDPPAAGEDFDRALSLLKEAPDAAAEGDALGGRGEVYLRGGEPARAEEALRGSLALCEQSGNARGRAEALLTLSELQNRTDHALAARTAQESLALWQSLGDARGQARAQAYAGNYYMAQNALDESAESFRGALRLWSEAGDRSGQGEALTALGFVEYRRGEWQECISLLTRAQEFVDEEAEPNAAGQIAAGLGASFDEAGAPEKGLAHYRRALDLYERAHYANLVTYALLGLGRTHFLLGEYAEAEARFREARASSGAGGLHAAYAEEYLGRIRLGAGDTAAALAHLNSALAAYERAGNRREAAQARALLGMVCERRGDVAGARRNYAAALGAFESLSDRVNESATLYALGRLELGRGDLAAAEDLLRRSVGATENVRRVSTSRDLMAAFSATVQERYQAYAECLMRRHAADPARGFDARAFEASEASRARSLAELLRATETSLVPGLDPQLAERERSLRRSLRVKEDERVTMLGGTYAREELDALDAETARLSSEYESVVGEIRARHPAFGQLARADAWDLPRLRERVVPDDETVLLEYSLGAERGYVWALTRGGLEAYELPGRAAVARAAGEVYARLAAEVRPGAAADDGLEAAARELSRMVLAPAARALEGRTRVVVVADGALEYVPFQLLPDPANAAEPMVAGREVVNAPSASILGQLAEEAARRRAPSRTLAAFGDPVFASNYAARRDGGGGHETAALARAEAEGWRNSLRDVRVEGDSFDPASVRSLFYSGLELSYLSEAVAGADVASGFDATRERLQGTDLSGYAILHFATHGLLDPEHPERSGLLLSTVDREGRAREGLVSLRDIYGLRAPVGLVVLSACRTALGKEVRGEGLIGLTRGFMYAGASGVVSSLWRVEDEATAELMRRFYGNMLRRAMTPAAALRDAQNSIRREPQWRSPHYWAAFTLQGEHRQLIAPPPAAAPPPRYATALAAATLATLAALVFAALLLRRRVAPFNHSTSKK